MSHDRLGGCGARASLPCVAKICVRATGARGSHPGRIGPSFGSRGSEGCHSSWPKYDDARRRPWSVGVAACVQIVPLSSAALEGGRWSDVKWCQYSGLS